MARVPCETSHARAGDESISSIVDYFVKNWFTLVWKRIVCGRSRQLFPGAITRLERVTGATENQPHYPIKYAIRFLFSWLCTGFSDEFGNKAPLWNLCSPLSIHTGAHNTHDNEWTRQYSSWSLEEDFVRLSYRCTTNKRTFCSL